MVAREGGVHEVWYPQEGREIFDRALRIKEAHYGPEHVEVAITLNHLANANGALGDSGTEQNFVERAIDRAFSSVVAQ